jgi:integrase
MHLTDLTIRGLSVEQGQKDFSDDALPGFAVRVGKRSKTFMLLVGSGANRRRVTLGAYPYLSLSVARSKAKALIGEAQQPGTAPAAITVAEACSRFEELHLNIKNRPSTARTTKRLLQRHLVPALGSRRLSTVTKHQLSDIIDGLIDSPSECRHFYVAAKTFFRFCERRGYIAISPLNALEAPTRPVFRERALSAEEVAKLIAHAKTAGVYGKAILLLLFTGQRLGQISKLNASFIDYEAQTISWSGELMKSGKPHTIPYGPLTKQVLDTLLKQGWVIRNEAGNPITSNWTRGHLRLLHATGLSHFTRHDLRRTYSTLQASIGTPLHITELLLAHRTGTISGVAAIYNRWTFADEMRKAAQAYETYLSSLTP